MVALTAHHLRAIRQAGKTRLPGLAYSSSLDMSHSRRPSFFGWSTSTMRVCIQWRFSSFSYWNAKAGSAVHAKPSIAARYG